MRRSRSVGRTEEEDGQPGHRVDGNQQLLLREGVGYILAIDLIHLERYKDVVLSLPRIEE